MRKILMLFLVSFFHCFVAFGQEKDTTFENANAAYNAGQFEKAVMLYKQILESGQHSAELYFNLGNSYYRLNQVGESIFYFEKAKQLQPTDEDINVNSSFAQNMAIDAVEVLPKSQVTQLKDSIIELFSQEGWAYFIVLLAWLLVLFWGLYLWNKIPFIKRTFFVSSLVLALFLIGSLFIAVIKSANTADTTYGILFNEKMEVWAEPNSRAEVLFLLHEGTKVQMLDELQDWQKIRIANGSEGWIKNAKVRSLKGFK
ncbi:MAG: tetratricopeptide repeat protein [Flavobacteriaceae bacterium]|jgi:tetratricopeptide (TPR) repeat protein|nr:tetratricopeptide repeat protein [Flavobacteriaceae bacterium]MDG1029011.1 tetratricopeptide repeat protein [Flavobacteriaceae bacterium]MDG1942099.1 tetratricopeptide repeat protein [Flavobacteriaceae bacterium]|tara:strand:+ start:55 stop:825 length:771 start_codon:yes stop_codon:yes gene_type:complete